MSQKHPVQEIAETCGSTITKAGLLPDGSGFAIMSMPLPKTHWIYNTDDSISSGPAPMPFRMGCEDEIVIRGEILTRKQFADKIRTATRYAVRASIMCGKEMDFDPDAMVQNMVCGMLGYWTEDGLSNDNWSNPPDQQRKES